MTEIFSDVAAAAAALAAWYPTAGPCRVAAITGPRAAEAVLASLGDCEPVHVSLTSGGVDVLTACASATAVSGLRKVLVVDEYDAIASFDPSLKKQVLTAAKEGRVPVVLVADAPFKAKCDVPRGAARFEVTAPRPPNPGQDSLDDRGLVAASRALAGERDRYSGDGIANGAVFDNYLGVKGVDFARVAQAFSDADCIDEGMCRAHVFDDLYAALPITAASLAVPSGGARKELVRFGTVWSKTNAAHARAGELRALQFRMHEVRPRAGDDLDYVRQMMAARLEEGSYEGVDEVARAAGVDAEGAVTLMRGRLSGPPLARYAPKKTKARKTKQK